MSGETSSAVRLRLLCAKELNSYFNNPTAYIIAIVFLLITGYSFTEPLFLNNEATISPFVELVPLLLLFFMPALTMRLFSEEAKSGTLEVLMVMPVREWEIVVAKFLAALALLGFALALTWAYPVSVACLGQVDLGTIYGSYVGLFLTGALLAGVGVFASSLSRNQALAFIIAFLISFVFYSLGKLGPFVPLRLSPLTEFLGWDSHLDALSRGVFDSSDFVYFLTATAAFLFFAQERLKGVREK